MRGAIAVRSASVPPAGESLAGHARTVRRHPETHEQYPSGVKLLPFDAAHDRQQLRVWLHRPRVARRWGDPDLALAAARQHRSAAHALIAVDTTPVGYLCWQRPPPEELAAAGISDLPTGLTDVDILIGEPGFNSKTWAMNSPSLSSFFPPTSGNMTF